MDRDCDFFCRLKIIWSEIKWFVKVIEEKFNVKVFEVKFCKYIFICFEGDLRNKEEKLKV